MYQEELFALALKYEGNEPKCSTLLAAASEHFPPCQYVILMHKGMVPYRSLSEILVSAEDCMEDFILSQS